MILTCTNDRLDIWLAWTDEIRDPPLLADYRAVLSDQERERCDRFHFERDRHVYLVAHALVRSSLSRYADVAPEDWAFDHNRYGRPEVKAGLTAVPLRFNLSHTHGLVACAVTSKRDVGVDVEWLDRRGETVALADRFFAPAEVRALRRVAPPLQLERFFTYWTLKESYIKARGMGLSLALDRFSFAVETAGSITLAVEPELGDDGSRWTFGVVLPRDRHMLAYAVERGSSDRVDARIRATVPLVD